MSHTGYVFTGVRFFFFQAEDGIRDLVRSRGLGDVYKRQSYSNAVASTSAGGAVNTLGNFVNLPAQAQGGYDLSLIHI